MKSRSRTFFEPLLERAGVTIDGSEPHDLILHDERMFDRVIRFGTLGLGEAYMDGWWDSPQLHLFFEKVLSADLGSQLPVDFGLAVSWLRGQLVNMQRLRVREVGEKHYDIGNELYSKMLDSRMIYSCGYWRDATTLDEAQEAKLDLICRKVGLKPGMRILDIGSGWGGFLKFAAERYGVEGLGVTISKEQAAWANAHTDGLPIRTELIDYMALDGQFDRIISIGMFEHVGYKNYARYFRKVRELLKDDGLFLLHTIGGSFTRNHGDPWSEKYIFPNGMLPSAEQLGRAYGKLFVMEDWHNFGAYYDPTLMAWLDNFNRAWPSLKGDKYDDRFYRMWVYYLQIFAALFRVRHVQLWQIVFAPKGVRGVYERLK